MRHNFSLSCLEIGDEKKQKIVRGFELCASTSWVSGWISKHLSEIEMSIQYSFLSRLTVSCAIHPISYLQCKHSSDECSAAMRQQ